LAHFCLSLCSTAFASTQSIRISDEEYEELLALCDPETIPSNPIEARQALENFVDLVEILLRPLPLPPGERELFP